MESGGRGGLLYMLLERDLSDFDVRKVPQTVALAEQKAFSRRGLDLLVETLARDGVLPSAHLTRPNIAITSGEAGGRGFYADARRVVPGLKHIASTVIHKELLDHRGCKH